jgi:hypothetical protein
MEFIDAYGHSFAVFTYGDGPKQAHVTGFEMSCKRKSG